jgi:hypothetical protein
MRLAQPVALAQREPPYHTPNLLARLDYWIAIGFDPVVSLVPRQNFSTWTYLVKPNIRAGDSEFSK